MMNIFELSRGEKKCQSKKHGFTMVEVMVATGLGLIVLLGIFLAMNSGQTAWLTGQGAVELRLEVIKALTRMEGEIRGTAPSIVQTLTPALINCDNPTSSLTFELPKTSNGTVLNSADHIVWSAPIQYSFNNATGQVIRTVAGVNTVVANNITSLSFTENCTSADILYIDITAAKRASNRRQMNDTGHIDVKMRNI
jgi:prepilin-type N-terminal cleavage/methylation domain-containing protein